MRDEKSSRRDRQKQKKITSKKEVPRKEDLEQQFVSIDDGSKESKTWSNIYENASGKLNRLIAKQTEKFDEIEKKEKKKKQKNKGGNSVVKRFKLSKM